MRRKLPRASSGHAKAVIGFFSMTRALPLRDVWLFGSHARGDARPAATWICASWRKVRSGRSRRLSSCAWRCDRCPKCRRSLNTHVHLHVRRRRGGVFGGCARHYHRKCLAAIATQGISLPRVSGGLPMDNFQRLANDRPAVFRVAPKSSRDSRRLPPDSPIRVRGALPRQRQAKDKFKVERSRRGVFALDRVLRVQEIPSARSIRALAIAPGGGVFGGALMAGVRCTIGDSFASWLQGGCTGLAWCLKIRLD